MWGRGRRRRRRRWRSRQPRETGLHLHQLPRTDH
jgi:hypothetical protein